MLALFLLQNGSYVLFKSHHRLLVSFEELPVRALSFLGNGPGTWPSRIVPYYRVYPPV